MRSRKQQKTKQFKQDLNSCPTSRTLQQQQRKNRMRRRCRRGPLQYSRSEGKITVVQQ